VLCQDQALRTLSARVVRHLARCAPRRPLTVMAVGPTGVGKTRSAVALAAALRRIDPQGPYGFLRLDMAEYAEEYRVSQLLGAPQGYIGHFDGAQLIDALVANPRIVVVFDEIEKAHPTVFKTLMAAMDTGRLSSARATAVGREIDCRRAIFLFTSNLGVTEILADLEGREVGPNGIDDVCRHRLRGGGLASEIVGRINAFLLFRPLTAEDRAQIVTVAVATVAREYGLDIARVAPDVVVHLLNESRGEGFGARPDEYLIDQLLGNAFVDATRSGLRGTTPLEFIGPPFELRPFTRPPARVGPEAGRRGVVVPS
jgi:ATP-dependent Clp protease ATP-binding subunit ClpA